MLIKNNNNNIYHVLLMIDKLNQFFFLFGFGLEVAIYLMVHKLFEITLYLQNACI